MTQICPNNFELIFCGFWVWFWVDFVLGWFWVGLILSWVWDGFSNWIWVDFKLFCVGFELFLVWFCWFCVWISKSWNGLWQRTWTFTKMHYRAPFSLCVFSSQTQNKTFSKKLCFIPNQTSFLYLLSSKRAFWVENVETNKHLMS